MLKAVIFDMDGVLVDTESKHYPVLRDLMAEYGYVYTQEHFLRYCGIPEQKMWDMLLAEAGLHLDSEEMRKEHWRRYYRYEAVHGIPAFPGTEQLLSALKMQGYRMAVASASFEKEIVRYLERLGYSKYFDCAVSAQSCAHGKPEPDVFLVAARKLDVKPEECMVVEDSTVGMLAAKRAGMKWIGFCGSEIPADMSQALFHFSDYQKVTPEDFMRWYEQFPKINE